MEIEAPNIDRESSGTDCGFCQDFPSLFIRKHDFFFPFEKKKT